MAHPEKQQASAATMKTDPHNNGHSKEPTDQALVFLHSVGAASTTTTPASESREYLQKLRRKVDWHILPILFLCYTMQFLDKVLLNYAVVMGLPKDLHLKGNDFSNAATAFFIAYLIAEIPNGIALNKVPAGKWLGINVTLWGIATACTAAAHNYTTLLAARIFLGIFEAAIAPCLMMLSSQWYTKSEQAPRFSLWYCGLGAGQILGGLVSFGFQHVGPKEAVHGWKLMFIVLGIVTVAIGLVTFFFIPDSPMAARFLGTEEKVAILQHVAVNKTGVRGTEVTLGHVKEAFLDPQLWLMTLMTILISVSSGVVTTFSATVIRNFGYTPKTAALLNMPGGLISIFSTLAVGYGIRYTSNRWAWIVACCIPGILGGALMSFLPAHNHAGLLAGVYLVNFVVATLIVIYQWTASNIAGTTKRAFSLALISGGFSVGNIIGPQTFQAHDAPQYIPAKIAVLATQAGGALVAVVLFGYYVWENKRRDKAAAEKLDSAAGSSVSTDASEGDWANLTDRENRSFRYVY